MFIIGTKYTSFMLISWLIEQMYRLTGDTALIEWNPLHISYAVANILPSDGVTM